jgi:lipoprotein-releasing system permease protein
MVWTFATRYFIARKSTQAINIISWVTVSAIAVGAGALIVVLSVFNGFEELVESLYSSFYPEIKVSPVEGKTILLPLAKLRAIQGVAGVMHISGVIQEKTLLRYGEARTIAVLMGVDNMFGSVTGVKRKVIRGTFDLGSVDTPRCVMGAGIEENLGIDLQRNLFPVTAYIPNRNAPMSASPADALSAGNMDPAGAFAIQQDFDNMYVISNIGFVRQLAGLQKDEFSSLYIRLKDPALMNEMAVRLRRELGKSYLVQTRYQQNQSLYQVMQTEKWVVYAILSFIMIIAAFNLIGSLYMLVIDKARDISILKAMGSSRGMIRRIFLAEGILLSMAGAALGAFLALIICLVQKEFGIIGLQGNSFIIDAYPVSMHVHDFLLVFITIILIAILASLYPAGRASGQLMDLKGQ